MDPADMPLPELTTDRLILRAFTVADCPAVAGLCSDEQIAATTLLIPHPYQIGDAEEWIGTHEPLWKGGKQAQFAVTQREDGAVVGSMGLTINRQHCSAELGYWIGRPYWGRGYATEAGRAVVVWAFEALGLNRVHAHHMDHNPASGRVLQKIGLKREGLARQAVVKNGVARDCPLYAILRSDRRG